MKTISKILFDSVDKRKQSFQSLAEVGGTIDNKIISKYCAIGAVGCEIKYVKLIKRTNNWSGYSYDVKGEGKEREILINAGVPLKVIKQDFRKWISHDAFVAIAKKDDWILRDPLPLDILIMSLNDSCRWNFEKIAKEIERLEDRGSITYGSS